MASAGQIPIGLQLSVSAPLGVRAYRRRFQSPMTNVQAAGPDNHINIYPDTSTPGAFIDHESTYLSFDFKIKNNEFGVDFTDFGVEGAAGALIQDWRVYNQGTILEEILDYPTVASALASAEGAYELETTMYFSSKLRTGYQSEAHRNFIKPPMVDGSGNIMFGPNPFGLGTQPLNPLGDVPVYYNKGSPGVQGAGQLYYNPHASLLKQGAAYSNATTDRSIIDAAFAPKQGRALGSQTSSKIDSNDTEIGPRNEADIADATAWCGHVSPAAFPDFFAPGMADIVRNRYVQEFGTINKVQVMANLCNVKCFPIGMVPAVSCFSATETNIQLKHLSDDTALTALTAAKAPVASNPTYRICYRPLSGIFGKMATKMLATTLLAPQQMYISIRLAQAAHVFNVSADPCRRIAGTVRDFVRNLGTRYGGNYGGDTFTFGTNVVDSATPSASDYALGYHPYLVPRLGDGTIGTQCNLASLIGSAGCEGREIIYGAASTLENSNRTVKVPEDVTGTALVTGGLNIGGVEGGLPKPQYVLCKEPWKYNCLKTTGTAINYAAECEVFYGTYLPSSEPQARRCLGMTINGTTNNALPNITYEVTNMNLVGDQIILPSETTSDVILAAEAGNNNVSTNSVRTYPIQVRNDSTQSIILPIKVNMAKRLFVIFQDQEQRDSTLGFLHDSNCGINPFASVSSGGSAVTKTGFISGAAVAGTLTGVGVDQTISYKFNKAGDNQGISMQLRIGNDFYPPQPLTTIQEISTEYVKALEGWQDVAFSPDIDSRVIATATYATGVTSSAGLVYDCLQPSKYCTAFVPIALLDDQTITGNPDFVPLYSQTGGAHYNNTSADSAFKSEAKVHQNNGYNMICPRGYCVQGMFKSPSSRFMLGFNLRSFKDIDGVEGGTYLGNNTITLLMSGCHGLNVSNRSYRGLAIVPHRAMMRYSPGGQIVWAY